ncbi:MAG: hypothetical protein QOF44_5462 [Streptomyces sp.]|jgi:uncharacterized protein YkwD|nr:hypothetical protein [Streptomyces sp.]
MGRHSRTAPPPVIKRSGGRRRRTNNRASLVNAKRRRHHPVRTGLLATSAAMAVGAIAVSAGLLPGPNGSGGYAFPGSNAGQVQAGGQSENTGVQGGASATPTDRASEPASRGNDRSSAPVATPSAPVATPSTSAPVATPSPSASTTAPTATPSATASSTASEPANTGNSAEDQVLALVNAERAKIGCAALIADPDLGKLAEAFSKDMAKRDFFDHIDPDGNDPWDRAEAAGITGLGGENIARGQPDAASVMDAWMNSPGHRANILNCNFKTIGVGAFLATGGPWWTQDFGY